MISVYLPDGEGRLVPQIPSQGACSSWDERPCRVCKDHERDRKTGPCFPIWVLRCLMHRHGFTLYPPGHVPYGRKRLAPLAYDGRLEQAEGCGGAERFRTTYFEAALDARDRKPWPQEGYEGSRQERFPTQMRQLRRAARLLGVAPELDGKRREEIAAILSVPGQVLHDAARLLGRRAGYRGLGQAACRVLQALPWAASLFERLAECGFCTGYWPAPRVCPGPGRPLRRTPFRSPGTRSPPSWP